MVRNFSKPNAHRRPEKTQKVDFCQNSGVIPFETTHRVRTPRQVNYHLNLTLVYIYSNVNNLPTIFEVCFVVDMQTRN